MSDLKNTVGGLFGMGVDPVDDPEAASNAPRSKRSPSA